MCGYSRRMMSTSLRLEDDPYLKPRKPSKPIVFKPSFKSVKMQMGKDARQALFMGVDCLASAGQVTLGPGGRNVALDYEAGQPKLTKDGVTVVKTIHLANRSVEMGAKLLKKIAGNTNTYAGDGTTSSALLAREILKRGIHAVEFEKAHPIAVKRGIDKGLQVVLSYLKEISMPVTQAKELNDVCMISSNYNQVVSEVVSQTLSMVGLNGVVNMTESHTGFTQFALVNGLVLERGFVTELFLDEENKGNRMQEMEAPLVLVVSDAIRDVKDIVPVMEICKKAQRPLLLFSEDLQPDPMSTLVYNNKKGIVESCAVNIPWMNGVQKEMLKDVAVMTGATCVDNGRHGLKIEDVQLHHFGSAKNVSVDPEFTRIVGGNFSEKLMQERLEEIDRQIALEEKHLMKGIHRERQARMQAKIAEIQIGGGTEVEQGEERDLIVDALNSARSALEFGILPGGGTALLQASHILDSGIPHLLSGDPSEAIGVKILQHALQQPIKVLIENKTGRSSAHIIDKLAQKVEEGNLFAGFDVKNEQIVDDMMEAGIIDSFKVVKTYLSDAVSLAGLILATEVLVVKQKNYEPLPFSHYQNRREFF